MATHMERTRLRRPSFPLPSTIADITAQRVGDLIQVCLTPIGSGSEMQLNEFKVTTAADTAKRIEVWLRSKSGLLEDSHLATTDIFENSADEIVRKIAPEIWGE
jgi:hypothetical protein